MVPTYLTIFYNILPEDPPRRFRRDPLVSSVKLALVEFAGKYNFLTSNFQVLNTLHQAETPMFDQLQLMLTDTF